MADNEPTKAQEQSQQQQQNQNTDKGRNDDTHSNALRRTHDGDMKKEER